MISCPNGDSPSIYRHVNCHKVTCPVCHDYSAVQQSRRIERRLTGIDEAYKGEGVKTGQWKHIQVSDSPDNWTPEKVIQDKGKAFKKACRQVLKDNAKGGWWGGVEIFHPYRKKHKDGSECTKKNCKKKHFWAWGPHCHYLTKGYFVQSDVVHKKTGFVLKRIPELDGRKRDLRDTAHYQLTHSAIFMTEGHVYDSTARIDVHDEKVDRTLGLGYTYVGKYANTVGCVKVASSEFVTVPCENCGTPLHSYPTADNTEKPAPDLGHDEGEIKVRLTTVEAYLIHRKITEVCDYLGNVIKRIVRFEKGPSVLILPPAAPSPEKPKASVVHDVESSTADFITSNWEGFNYYDY